MQLINRKEAKTQGLQWYFTGKPCKHGHVAERLLSNGGCRVCLSHRRDVWHTEHKEYNKKRREENPGRHREFNRRWYANNAEYKKEYNRQWSDENPEYLRTYRKQPHVVE